MIKGILIVSAVGLVAIAVCQPAWLSRNTFLEGFVTHEILALMAVILTVTLASVANIHLALNRIVLQKFNNKPEFVESAKSVKTELNDNAWYIFWGFIAVILALIVKGAFGHYDHVLAAAYAISLWVLVLYLACMYDIYKVVFGIVELEMDIGAGKGNGENFASESPEIGGDK